MTTIGLIRHGITDWNIEEKAQGHSDIPLNEKGRIQAQRVATRLLNENWDMLISSNLSRAGETAQIIGKTLNIPTLLYDERLREINCGKIEGMTEEERVSKWGINWREADIEMEHYNDVALRGEFVLKEIINSFNGKKVLVVSHGALIGLTLQKILPLQFPKTYIDNTSITILTYINQTWKCPLYNCTNHLYK
ncbi:histidine phosphatase family protein [Chengkuizengella axinellae]|uniref:Histidine phosphatase family protein n=1 Tax=Chengkuizengella axinellae TaxID=3064388 RepID=A0ABT9J1D0_9BACL|nr:histidine phosphatase family protein [Chengkuizengella sp. 2205SS18-9]MDP5275426.1 histidine phosphatase family protein [Chengkuizengella sp. 2205SS18-9]